MALSGIAGAPGQMSAGSSGRRLAVAIPIALALTARDRDVVVVVTDAEPNPVEVRGRVGGPVAGARPVAEMGSTATATAPGGSLSERGRAGEQGAGGGCDQQAASGARLLEHVG